MYCKRCGTPLHLGVVICPECGARQRRQSSSVRCASCRRRVPVSLSVCPHCGRDVRPAGPRWGIWLAVGIAMVLMVLWGLGKLPLEQTGQDIVGIKAKISGLVQVLGPAPTAGQPEGKPQVIARATVAVSPTLSAVEEQPGAVSEAELAVSAVDTEEATPEPFATEVVAVPIEAPPSGAQTITATVTVVPTLAPTSAPTPTATAVPPTATQPAPTATATAARAPGSQANTYRVRAGDTLSGIAQQFKVSLDALLAANRITAATTLRIGQELVIPGAGVPPAPTATRKPQATAIPTTPPPTPLPYLPVPMLNTPGDQASYTGDRAQIFLAWDAVPGMIADDRYQVVIRWIEQGALQEKSDLFTTATSIQVPPWLWGRADQPERRYQWFVRTVRLTTDGQGGELVIPLSPASQTRTFYWP